MDAASRSGVISFAEARERIPGPNGERNILAFKRGTLDVKLVVPVPPNPQTPHAQDEIYIVLRGRGIFVHGGVRERFGPGDILFVAAGIEHHYESYSDDFVLWRIFYGAEGGEIPA